MTNIVMIKILSSDDRNILESEFRYALISFSFERFRELLSERTPLFIVRDAPPTSTEKW